MHTELDRYFEPALALGLLLQQLVQAPDSQKEEIKRQILNSQYLVNLRTMQSMSDMDFSHAPFPDSQLNSMRRDYIINPAVPSRQQENRQIPIMSSGYHRHDYFEFVLVLRGTYVQLINGVRYQHTAGDICILPPNIMHREEALKWDDRTLFIGVSRTFFQTECMRVLHLCPELYRFFSLPLMQSGSRFVAIHLPEHAISPLVLFVLKEDDEKKSGHHMLIKGCLLRLLEKAVTEGEHSFIHQSYQEQQQNLSNEILQYMESHLDTVTRAQLAKYFHFNEDYLNRFLKQATGHNYSENLRELRMKRAAYLLHCGESTASVMRSLGLTNKGHFNRMFQSTFGVLPGEYKKQPE